MKRRQWLGSLSVGVVPWYRAVRPNASEERIADEPPELDVLPGGRWPGHDHDAEGTRYNVEAYAPTDNVEERWSVPSWGNEDISQNVDLVSDGDTVYVRDASAILAFDAETGEERWTVRRSFRGELFVDEGVLVATEDFNEDHAAGQVRHMRVYGIDKTSGDVLWRFDTGFHRDHEPIIHDGRLYLTGAEYVPTGYSGDPDLLYPIEATLYCLDLHTGDLLWDRVDSEDVFDASGAFSDPIVYDEHVFLNGRKSVVKFDLDGEGVEQFLVNEGSPHIDTITAGHGQVYVAEGFRGHTVRGIDPETGADNWAVSVENDGIVMSLLVADEHVVYCAKDRIGCLTPSGDVVWERSFEFLSRPVGGGDVVYVKNYPRDGSKRTVLLGLDITSGETVFRHRMQSYPAIHAPIVLNNKLLIPDSDLKLLQEPVDEPEIDVSRSRTDGGIRVEFAPVVGNDRATRVRWEIRDDDAVIFETGDRTGSYEFTRNGEYTLVLHLRNTLVGRREITHRVSVAQQRPDSTARPTQTNTSSSTAESTETSGPGFDAVSAAIGFLVALIAAVVGQAGDDPDR